MTRKDQTKSAKRTTTTTYWTRRFVFACNHTTDRYYPVKDTTNTESKKANVPFVMPLRVGRDCSACIRHILLERAQTKANAVRAGFDALCARLDRSLKKLDDDLDQPLLVGEGEDEHSDKYESWPQQPPTLDSLYHLFLQNNTASDTITASRPKEKLSTRLRSIREDFEKRVQTWDQSAKSSKTETAIDDADSP